MPRLTARRERRDGSEGLSGLSSPARLVCSCGAWLYASRLRWVAPRSPLALLEVAGTDLLEALTRYCGRDAFVTVGLCDDPRDPHLIVYTRQRSEANRLAAFVGGEFRGFKVVGRALGRTVLARGRLAPPRVTGENPGDRL